MQKERVTKDLNPFLKRRLAVYALAGSTGVAAVTAASPVAQGAVVYTSAHQFGLGTYDAEAVIPIDLNHDGVTDFTLVGTELSDFSTGGLAHTAAVFVVGGSGNKVAGSGTVFQEPEAQALRAAQKIVPALPFAPLGRRGLLLAFNLFGAVGGNFDNLENRFLALELQSNGQTYYGWARVNVRTAGGTFFFELVDYAYQDTPNVPIRAGEGIPEADATFPAPGLLAHGSDAIPAWRSGGH